MISRLSAGIFSMFKSMEYIYTDSDVTIPGASQPCPQLARRDMPGKHRPLRISFALNAFSSARVQYAFLAAARALASG